MDRLLTENQDQVIGVVMEPLVQGAAGMIVHPEGYLRGVRELTKRHDVLLICDEVATGFGRTGKMFACQHEDVSPDILCVAKGLTGGYLPMAATLVCDPVYQQFLGRIADFRQFFHGHTYAGNPLAAAAALASLDIFSDENTLDNVNQRSQQLTNRLASIAASPIVGDIRQRGLMVGIELVQDQATKAPFPTAQLVGRRFCQAAIERGVWLRPLGDVIVLMPPLSTTADELDFVLDVIAECCAAMTQQFLPAATSRTVVSSTIGGNQ